MAVQRCNIGDQHAGKIEEVEAEGAPLSLDDPPDIIIEIEGNGQEQNVHPTEHDRTGDENVADKPPDLAVENGRAVEAEEGVEQVAGVDDHKEIHHRRADGHIEHEVGNPLVLVAVAEALKVSAQVFHKNNLLNGE